MVLYLNYKHYHWQTFGPLFRDLHKLFDRLADEVVESVDPLAERVRMVPISNAFDNPAEHRAGMHVVDGGNEAD